MTNMLEIIVVTARLKSDLCSPKQSCVYITSSKRSRMRGLQKIVACS